MDLEESVLQSPYVNPLIRQYVLTSLTKLYARPAVSDTQRGRIASILEGFSTSAELEIQQRAVEFDSLFDQREIVVGVLEQMPAPEIKATVIGTVSEKRSVGPTQAKSDNVGYPVVRCHSGLKNCVLPKLIGDDDLLGPGASTGPQHPQSGLESLLAGASSPTGDPAGVRKATVNDIMGLFDTPSISTSPNPQPQATPLTGLLSQPTAQPLTTSAAGPPASQLSVPSPHVYIAYDRNGLKITLQPQVNAAKPGMIIVLARFLASSGQPISNVNFQAAVPKVSCQVVACLCRHAN